MKSYHRLFWLAIVCSAFTCDTGKEYAAKANIEPALPTRNQLWDAFRDSGKLTFVYGKEEEKFTNLFEEIGDSLDMGNGRYFKLEIKAADEITEEEAKESVLFLLGTPTSNRLLDKLKYRLPIEWSPKGMKFDGKLYTDQTDVFKLFFYPNPYNPKIPLYLITGNSEEAIYQLILDQSDFDWSGLVWSSWGYELYKQKERRVFGRFSDSTWLLDKRIHYDFSLNSDTILTTPHFRFIQSDGLVDGKGIEELAKKCERSYEDIRSFLDKSTLSTQINYHFIHIYGREGPKVTKYKPGPL